MATEDYYLNILPSSIFYDKLDRAKDDEYIREQNPYWKIFIREQSIKTLSIFNTLVKGFYYVSHMHEDEMFYDDRWNYLYFWTGLKVLDNKYDSSFSEVMDVLKSVRDRTDKNIEYYDLINTSKEHLKDLKQVYDYLQNYETIELRISPHNSECSLMYKEYVQNSYASYNDMKRKCKNYDTEHHCKVFNILETKYKKKDIKDLTCSGTQVPQKVLELQDFKDSEEDEDGLQRHGTPASHILSVSGGFTRDMTIGDRNVSPSSGYTSALMTAFPLLGTASLAFFFLKFTPIGSRFYSSIFRKQIVRCNEEEEAQEILGNSYEFLRTNIEDTKHNIAYHSM
ncbi:PIR Superfamily Protein [Plasmodium ovale wallikeri]|uniref:PIR Superfamily Protein n=1 Tax=Plasmodium ovale wallikeri TaxID=864142 RepID=A0A1A8YGJ3_PLAOA|nr:PIR Superfamily Protein [Plasmodium ovale wallikeri]SBT58259.1 PIR Superfamily Protein [Plasmodium ovale wallikeri]